jgi:hypothetical protein
MSKKIIPATFHRNEYEKDVFQDAIIYTLDIPVAAVTKITNTAITSFGLAAGLASTTLTRLQFDTLEGNLPWSSYSKFASPSAPAGGSFGGLPTGSLPKAGAVTITEGGIGTEVIYYGSITWTSATAGFLNNLKRGATPLTFTGGATGTFTNVIPVREKITIWNQTGGILYIGDSAAIATTPVNCVKLGQNEEWSIWLEPLQDIWVLPAVPGSVNIAEYR